LKEDALNRIMWRTRFGKGYGPFVRQTKDKKSIDLFGRTEKSDGNTSVNIFHVRSLPGHK